MRVLAMPAKAMMGPRPTTHHARSSRAFIAAPAASDRTTGIALSTRGSRARARGAPARQRTGSVVRCDATAAADAPLAREYNAEFGIPGSLTVEEGDGGLTKVRLTHYNGSAAEVYLFGACVTSFTQPHGSEILYLRPDATFDGSKPIAGGIPLCFPQFGPGKMQQHGFARNSTWRIVSTSADVQPDYPEPAVLLELSDNAYTRGMWDCAFRMSYEVTLRRGGLKLELRVRNTDSKEWDFTAALHSYIGVLDAANPAVSVLGMQGKTFLDKVPDANNPVRKMDENERIFFGKGLVDSVYLDSDPETILDVGTGCSVAVENTQGFSDTVIWNPHETLQPSCWQHFVCVESAQVGAPVVLGPGDEWVGEANLSVFDHPEEE